MKKMVLPLMVALVLVLVSQTALAATPEPQCRMTAEMLGRVVEPVSRQLPDPSADLPGLTPAPLLKAVIGDCCVGNNVANCPAWPGWHVRCGSPQCDGASWLSCLYWH